MPGSQTTHFYMKFKGAYFWYHELWMRSIRVPILKGKGNTFIRIVRKMCLLWISSCCIVVVDNGISVYLFTFISWYLEYQTTVCCNSCPPGDKNRTSYVTALDSCLACLTAILICMKIMNQPCKRKRRGSFKSCYCQSCYHSCWNCQELLTGCAIYLHSYRRAIIVDRLRLSRHATCSRKQ